MKRKILLGLLSMSLLFLGACSFLDKSVDGINAGEVERIAQLELQLSGLLAQLSGLQSENEFLKETLSGATNNVQIAEKNNNLSEYNEKKDENTKRYSLEDGIMYLNGNVLYGSKLQIYSFCTANLDIRCRYGVEIIAENKDYLLFTAIESFYGEYYLSYLLDKTTNIAKSFELGDKLYTFDYISGDDMYINIYDGWILGGNGALRSKGYFDNYSCDECGITKAGQKNINLNDLKNYIVEESSILTP